MCACPQDATAVQAARNLLAQGFASVRPLKGGYEAWSKQMQRGGSVKRVVAFAREQQLEHLGEPGIIVDHEHARRLAPG